MTPPPFYFIMWNQEVSSAHFHDPTPSLLYYVEPGTPAEAAKEVADAEPRHANINYLNHAHVMLHLAQSHEKKGRFFLVVYEEGRAALPVEEGGDSGTTTHNSRVLLCKHQT